MLAVKEKLINELDTISKKDINEIYDFVIFLKQKRLQKQVKNAEKKIQEMKNGEFVTLEELKKEIFNVL